MTAASPTADHRGHLERLARRGSASLVGAGFSALFGVLLVVVVTNGFSPTLAGTLFAATSGFLILESVALLGTDTGLVKCLPAQIASGRVADTPRTLLVSTVPSLAFSVVMAVVLYLTAPALAPHLVGAGAADTMTLLLRTLALVLPVAALHDQVMAATRGTGSQKPTVVVDNVGRLGLQAAGVLAVYLAGGGALALAVAWSVPYVLGLVVGAVWLRRMLGRRLDAPGVAAPAPWRDVAREFWSFTAPRAIARITQTALKRSDIVLVAALASPADAALYTAATRFIVLGQLFVQSVQQALSPQISALFARGESRAANSVYQAATLWSVLAAWPLYLVLAGFAPSVMRIFGEGYDDAADVVVILSLTMLLAIACGSVDSVLLMAGHSWLSLRNSCVALAVNIGLSVALIPVAGLRGAAVAHALALVVRNLQPLYQVRRHLSMWPVTRSTVRVAGLAAGCFGTVGVLATTAGLPGAVDVALLAVALLVYLTGVWAWRSRLRLDVFGSALRRRSREIPHVGHDIATHAGA